MCGWVQCGGEFEGGGQAEGFCGCGWRGGLDEGGEFDYFFIFFDKFLSVDSRKREIYTALISFIDLE